MTESQHISILTTIILCSAHPEDKMTYDDAIAKAKAIRDAVENTIGTVDDLPFPAGPIPASDDPRW